MGQTYDNQGGLGRKRLVTGRGPAQPLVETVESGGTDLEQVTSDRTYYVRTDGSNSNDGTANTSGGAWLTIQFGLDWIASHLAISSGVVVTLQMGDGTYTENVVAPCFVGSGDIRLQGNTTTPANTIVTASSGRTIKCANTRLLVKAFQVNNTGGHVLNADNGGTFTIEAGMRFAATTGGSHMLGTYGGNFSVVGNYNIVGGGTSHVQLSTGSKFEGFGLTVTVSSTPAFSTAFMYAINGSMVYDTITYSGSATGPRYSSVTLSCININGRGANVYPGNVAGGTTSGGIYV